MHAHNASKGNVTTMLCVIAFVFSSYLVNGNPNLITDAACLEDNTRRSDALPLDSVTLLQTSLQLSENKSEVLPRADQNLTTEAVHVHEAAGRIKMESPQKDLAHTARWSKPHIQRAIYNDVLSVAEISRHQLISSKQSPWYNSSTLNFVASAIKNKLVERAMRAVLEKPPKSPFDLQNLISQLINLDAQRRTGWIFAGIWFTYLLACLIFECCAKAKSKPEVEASERFPGFDMAKFICVLFVFWAHTVTFVMHEFPPIHMQWGVWFGQPFVIPGLVFITGIMSQKVNQKSMIFTLIGFPCTLFLYDLLLNFMTLVLPGMKLFQLGRSGVGWYLECMFVWRLTLSPFFDVLGRRNIPLFFPYVILTLGCYLVWCGVFTWDPSDPLRALIGLKDVVPYRLFVYNTPYFALGLLKPVKEWTAIFSNRRIAAASTCILMVYWLGTLGSSQFRRLFNVACTEPEQCYTIWWTASIEVGTVDASSFQAYFWAYFQQALAALCLVPCSGMVYNCINAVLPKLAEFFVVLGSRTLYSYLLHWVLFILPCCRMGFTLLMADYKKRFIDANWLWGLFIFCLIVISHVALCGQLTERLFQWLEKTPIWIATALGFIPQEKKLGPTPEVSGEEGKSRQD